jgi:hypothetical protein
MKLYCLNKWQLLLLLLQLIASWNLPEQIVLISIGLQKSSRARVCASIIIMCWVFLNMPVFCALRQYFDILHKC